MISKIRETLAFGASAFVLFKQCQSKISHADFLYRKDQAMVIAHRGVYGSYPEHSVNGMIEAYYNGCDFIEFDVEASSDGILFIMHDPFLNDMTDVENFHEFDERRWYSHFAMVPDFTSEELKRLGLT